MGWCDDVHSKYYNTLIKFPFKDGAEKLYLNNSIYDVIVVIDYNLKPIIKGKGSAIFLHISRRNYKPTKGCIAVTKKNIFTLLSRITNTTKIIIT